MDGVQGASFARSDTEDTITGKFEFTTAGSYPLKINGSDDAKIKLSGSSNPKIQFQEGTTDKAFISWHSGGYIRLQNQEDASILKIQDDIVFSSDDGSNFHKVWHAGNDGAGSGLDADTLDGVQGANYLRADQNTVASGDITVNGGGGALTVAADSDIRFNNGSWTGEAAGKIQQNSNNLYIQGGSGGTIFRDDGGTNRWQVTGSGHWRPGQDSTYNIGESGVRVANVYADTLHGDGSNLTNLPAAVPSYAGLLKHFCGC